MTPYRLAFALVAVRQLERLDPPIAKRILARIERLASRADEFRHAALQGDPPNHFKLRVGDYRVIYTFDRKERVLTVAFVNHRREVYKQW